MEESLFGLRGPTAIFEGGKVVSSEKQTGKGHGHSGEPEGEAQPEPDVGDARSLNDYGFGTPTVSSRTRNSPPLTTILRGEGVAMEYVAGECETTPNPPTTRMPFVVGGEEDDKDDGRDAVDETGVKTGNASQVLPTTSEYRLDSQHRPNPWSVVNFPIQAEDGKAQHQNCGTPTSTDERVVGDFPFPAGASTSATTTAPSTPTSRPAAAKSISGVSVPVPVPRLGSSGWATNPDPAHVMLTLRAAVGQELYVTGERLLRCVEADHREIHGRPYRPMPVTGAERDQFHACLIDAASGSLRRLVLNFLRVQESYRALAVERDRDGADSRRDERKVEHGWGRRGTSGGGDGGRRGGGICVRDARRKKTKDMRRIAQRQEDISSLVTGPLSSPAEKARAARCERKCVCVMHSALPGAARLILGLPIAINYKLQGDFFYVHQYSSLCCAGELL